MALDATLSRWRIMTPRSCVSGMLSMVTVTLRAPKVLASTPSRRLNVQVVRCILYIHARRPIGGAIHHRHTQLYRPYHLPYPGLILFNRLINTRAQSPILRHNSIQV